jgi:8-oxo-dGTP pyrophosphatase MutT (NUDIX family)
MESDMIAQKKSQSKDSEKTRREISAGGIVFKRTRRGIMFGMIIDSYGKLAFPKGHVRQGERFSETAAREVCEELGLSNLRLLRRLGTNDIWFRDRFVHKGFLIHKYIHYYLFETDSGARISVQEKSSSKGERIKTGFWVPMDKVLERSSYENMTPIVRSAIRYIEKL